MKEAPVLRYLLNVQLRSIIATLCLLFPLLGAAQEIRFSVPRYSPMQAEREVVAAVIVLEAANQGRVGMEAIMSVIDNRAKGQSAIYENVVRKPYQFSSLNSAMHGSAQLFHLIAKAKNDRSWPLALSVVDTAAKGEIVDRTGGATCFIEGDIRPNWLRGVRLSAVIGAHRFFVPRTT